ncbi:hypothetical protein BD311DRAFT_762080 [Dichomitus squalens]|uniref:Uncharacterized protein n=1 Tax=Dichomitus squalens TaxID=114155 RepID=A0A4Q9MIU6_9APHY|nr:hypothetical protein BD311DRAFT_762080 [Dichomitus squalens]
MWLTSNKMSERAISLRCSMLCCGTAWYMNADELHVSEKYLEAAPPARPGWHSVQYLFKGQTRIALEDLASEYRAKERKGRRCLLAATQFRPTKQIPCNVGLSSMLEILARYPKHLDERVDHNV